MSWKATGNQVSQPTTRKTNRSSHKLAAGRGSAQICEASTRDRDSSGRTSTRSLSIAADLAFPTGRAASEGGGGGGWQGRRRAEGEEARHVVSKPSRAGSSTRDRGEEGLPLETKLALPGGERSLTLGIRGAPLTGCRWGRGAFGGHPCGWESRGSVRRGGEGRARGRRGRHILVASEESRRA